MFKIADKVRYESECMICICRGEKNRKTAASNTSELTRVRVSPLLIQTTI